MFQQKAGGEFPALKINSPHTKEIEDQFVYVFEGNLKTEMLERYSGHYQTSIIEYFLHKYTYSIFYSVNYSRKNVHHSSLTRS